MAPDKGGNRTRSSGSRGDAAPINPEDRSLIYFGAGGGGTLACAMLAMIVWLFARHAAPRANPPVPAAQNQARPAEAPAARGAEVPPAPVLAAAAPAGSPQPVTTPPAAAEDPLAPFLRIELNPPATDSAFDSDRGNLALVGPWPKALGIITADQLRDGGSFEDVATLPLLGSPTTVRYKPLTDGGLLVVGQQQPDAVVLVDAGSREPVQTIPLETGSPYWIAGASSPAAPEIYVATRGSGDARTMLRIDAMSRSVTATWQNAPLRDFAVSHDGSGVYCRTFDSPPGRGLLHPEVGELFHWNFNPERPYSGDDRRYLADPLGRFVVAGNRVWSSDFRARQPDLQFEAGAFLSTRPWAAGIEDSEFVIGSLNDGRIVRRFPLPSAWHRVQAIDDRRRQRDEGREAWADLLGGHVFADATHDRFVLATGWRILTFPFEMLDLPDEPLLLPADSAPSSILADDPLEFSMTPVSGNPTVELVASPDGASLEGNTLQWTPRVTDVGEHELAVRLTAGDVAHETRWTLQVRQRTLPLSFLVRGCHVSADGARLVAWGHDWPAHPLTPQERVDYQPENWRLAVVNVADRNLLAQAPFDAAIRQAAFCGPEIVVADAGQGGMRLVRLSGDDLHRLGEATAINGPVTPVADRVLAIRAIGEALDRQLHYYSLPDLGPRDPLTDMPPLEIDHRTWAAYHDARRLADGWLLDGVLWDDELKKPALLIAPDGLLQVSTALLPSPPTIAMEPVLAGYVCDRVPGPQRRPLPHGPSSEVDRDRLTFSPHVPAEFAVRVEGARTMVDEFDVISGQAVRGVPLRVGPPSPSYPYLDQSEAQVVTSPGSLFVTLAGEVYVIPLESRPTPFRIEPRQSSLELSARTPTRVTYEADGATSFQLEVPALGTPGQPFRLESDTGAFRIDAGDLNGLSTAVWQSVAQRGVGTALASEMDERTKRSADAYRRLINRRAPAGVPVCLDAYVRATREDGATAVLHHACVIVIPTQIFAKNKP
jgi:hypothetical protein